MVGGESHIDKNALMIALRHPIRRQILRRIVTLGPISPSGVSADLDEPLSNVSYHVRVLVECGAVELVDTTPVRGSLKHFYRGSVDEPWALEVLGLSGNGVAASGEKNEEPQA